MAFLDYSRLGQYIKTKEKHEARFNCVFCQDETYHLYINLKKQVYHCFKCGSKGKTNTNFATLNLIHYAEPEREIQNKNYHIKLPAPVSDLHTRASIAYLKSRSLKESDIDRHRIYAAYTGSIYFGRIIIPSNPYRGYCDYFVARAYTKLSFPKYLNPGGNKSLFISPVMPDEFHDQYWNPAEVMLVEGPFDFLKASRHGPCIALLGKTLSVGAARAIVARYSKVHILLDHGLAEARAALNVQDMLKLHVDTQILHIPKGFKDPGEMNPLQFEALWD